MFYLTYKKKTNIELIKILNSETYQLEARETAQKILDERQFEYEIADNKSELNELTLFKLVEKLEDYNLKVSISHKKKIIEICQDNYGLLIGLVSLTLCALSFIWTLYFLINADSTLSWKGYGLRNGGILTTTLLIVGIMQYQKDKMTRVKVNFKESFLEVRRRRIWNKTTEILPYKSIMYRRLKKKIYQLYLTNNKKTIILFAIKDNNVGNKTANYLSTLVERLNEEK
jgi:hypothetical protein